jgi:hypothetical protein
MKIVPLDLTDLSLCLSLWFFVLVFSLARSLLFLLFERVVSSPLPSFSVFSEQIKS